jgi:ATP/maltotriose-dependent transcriptional regulator MalT
MTCRRLIGRERELAELESALAHAVGEEPSVAFLAGDSGVGKTHLLSHLREHAVASGARVLAGECVSLGDGELPYVPLVAALRPLVRERDPVLETLAPAARAELAQLLPDLGEETMPAVEPDPSSQGRLFEALLALLDRLGRRAPVLLAIEDIHWADRSTRAFLVFLARSMDAERVLVIVTYRPDELHRRHPLRPLLAELERDPRSRRIDLQPLDRAELRELLEEIRGEPPPAALVDRLWARSEGNPLYAEELIAAGGDGRGPLPESLRDAFMLRFERLSPMAQAVLRVLAVARRADHATLAQATSLEPPVLGEALREAVAGYVVVADDRGRYAFRHALLAEVMADDLLPGERIQAHEALARALERRVEAGDDAPELAAGVAHHYYAAGDAPRAFTTALRAATAAERVYAYGEAAALLERALELWERIPEPATPAGGDHAELLARAADAHRWGHDPERGEALLRAAVAEVPPAEDPHRAADLLTRLAQAEWHANRPREAMESAQRAMDLLGEDDSAERAALLSWWANARMLQGRYREAVATARPALELAERSDSDTGRLRALNALGISLMAMGEGEEGLAALREKLELARSRQRPEELASAYVNLSDALNLEGRTAEALAVVEEGVREVTFRHQDAGRMSVWLEASVAEIALDAGDWKRAAAHLPAPDRRVVGTTLLHVELRRAELALGRGDDEGAARSLAVAANLAAESSEPQFVGTLGALLAEQHLRLGDLDGARAAVEDTLDRLEFCTEDSNRLARVAATGVAVEAERAASARDRHDEPAAAEAAQTAFAHLLRVRALAASGRPLCRAYLAGARAEAARARGRDLPARWAAAAAAWDAIGRPYPAVLARRRQAEAHVARDERADAQAAACAAREAARRLGARWLERELEWLAARARLRLEDETAEPAPEPELPFDLTPREAQVLALVARGATNREIGERLFMAEKTASVHVSRILRKLGVRSRTEAAAVAHRQGLARLVELEPPVVT